MLHGLSSLQQQQQHHPGGQVEQDRHIALERAVVDYLLTGPAAANLSLKELSGVVTSPVQFL
jgi:hypothetical protein